MAYSPKQWRAIKWYAIKDNLRPQLSAFPMVRFLNTSDQVVVHNILDITGWYDSYLKDASRKRARLRRKAIR